MKKFLKIGAALTALVLGLACFVACSNGDDDGDSRSVVAEYQAEDFSPCFYIFYSDGTFVYKAYAIEHIKGKYYNSPTKRGSVTMIQESYFDTNSEKYIPYNEQYDVTIDKNGDEVYLIDEKGGVYFLKD